MRAVGYRISKLDDAIAKRQLYLMAPDLFSAEDLRLSDDEASWLRR